MEKQAKKKKRALRCLSLCTPVNARSFAFLVTLYYQVNSMLYVIWYLCGCVFYFLKCIHSALICAVLN